MNSEQTSIYEMIENIVQVVFYTYYNYIRDPELKADLFQIGYLKAYELLNNGNYDPTMSLLETLTLALPVLCTKTLIASLFLLYLYN